MNADKDRDEPHAELSHAIIGAAMRVLNELKPGLDEKLYESALVIELRGMGLKVEQQRSFEVSYRGQVVGRLVPDLLVEEKIVVDPKVAEACEWSNPGFESAPICEICGHLLPRFSIT